jgi:hypothetical protein
VEVGRDQAPEQGGSAVVNSLIPIACASFWDNTIKFYQHPVSPRFVGGPPPWSGAINDAHVPTMETELPAVTNILATASNMILDSIRDRPMDDISAGRHSISCQ